MRARRDGSGQPANTARESERGRTWRLAPVARLADPDSQKPAQVPSRARVRRPHRGSPPGEVWTGAILQPSTPCVAP